MADKLVRLSLLPFSLSPSPITSSLTTTASSSSSVLLALLMPTIILAAPATVRSPSPSTISLSAYVNALCTGTNSEAVTLVQNICTHVENPIRSYHPLNPPQSYSGRLLGARVGEREIKRRRGYFVRMLGMRHVSLIAITVVSPQRRSAQARKRNALPAVSSVNVARINRGGPVG